MSLRVFIGLAISILMMGSSAMQNSAGAETSKTALTCIACDGDCVHCGGERIIWVDQALGDDRRSGLSKEEAVATIGRGAALVSRRRCDDRQTRPLL